MLGKAQIVFLRTHRQWLFFNVAFQKWLKSNSGKTYAEAIAAYYQILEDKKNGKTKIDKQFEYNTYIRGFLPIIRARALTRLLSAGNIKNSCRDIIVMKKATLMYWINNLLHFKQ